MSDGGGARVTFLGHSTVLIEMDGQRLLTDPILRTRVGPLRRTADAPPAALWAEPDAVLISHSHWDHLDVGSLRLLGTHTTLVVPRGLGRRLRARGFPRSVELEPGEHHSVGTLRVEATHAEHHGFGPPMGGTARAVGFLVEGTSRIWFAGDTAFFGGMAALDIGLDLALLPVWGWGPTLRRGEHLDPFGAARAVALVRPRIAVPIHWGTLHPVGLRWLRPATRIDPPHVFAQLVRRHAPGTHVRVLPVGATLELGAAGLRGPARPQDPRAGG